MKDRTNYFQSVVHILKGNLGSGILAMPLSFKHLGYASAIIALPLICLISAYCVHILIRSSRRISKRLNDYELNYSVLARRSFELGPSWLNGSSELVGLVVDTALLVTQIGVCCVYIIFVVDNVTSILASYHIHISQLMTFLAIFPFALALSCIRTLNRLAIASLAANLLQVVGLILIIEYLMRDFEHVSLRQRKAFSPLNEMALGFGSVMFAFEGISVVLPVYNRLKKREQFGSLLGIINVSFLSILALYFVVGFLGFLRYGPDVKDSITLNLPAEPLYDAVRAMFTISILLSYPLQFYVPNEIIWEWSKRNLLRPQSTWHLKDIDIEEDKDVVIVKTLDVVIAPKSSRGIISSPPPPPVVATLDATSLATANKTFEGLTSDLDKAINKSLAQQVSGSQKDGTMSIGSRVELVNDGASSSSSSASCDTASSVGDDIPVRYEYYCRLFVVVMTFALAICIPKLNLLMDLIGSFSGTLLCLTIPALIHMASYWEKLRGFKKCLMIIIDFSIIGLSLAAGLGGSYSSLIAIIGGNHQQQKP